MIQYPLQNAMLILDVSAIIVLQCFLNTAQLNETSKQTNKKYVMRCSKANAKTFYFIPMLLFECWVNKASATSKAICNKTVQCISCPVILYSCVNIKDTRIRILEEVEYLILETINYLYFFFFNARDVLSHYYGNCVIESFNQWVSIILLIKILNK